MKPLAFPHLETTEANALNAALALREAGAKVTISVVYKKTTNSKPRNSGDDFVKIPGVCSNVILGTVSGVKTNQKGERYLLVDAFTRQPLDPTQRGWTCLKPEGVLRATVLRIALPKALTPKAPEPKHEMLTDKEAAELSDALFSAPEMM